MIIVIIYQESLIYPNPHISKDNKFILYYFIFNIFRRLIKNFTFLNIF